MKVSVVSATYNRASLLDRALATYALQTMPTTQWEYVIVDDGSDDDTHAVVQRWQSRGLPLVYIHAANDFGMAKVAGQWRDGCKLRNAGSVEARGEMLIMTHPEILVPPDALQVAYDALLAEPSVWVTAIPFWLPPLGDAQWPEGWEANLGLLNGVGGFYDPSWPDAVHSPGAPDYRNQNQETRHDWESEVWWGMTMTRWRWLGGFREFEQWGSVDMDFVARRRVSSTHTRVLTSPKSMAPSHTLMVYHQRHDSKRDMDLAMLGVRNTDYSSIDRMREQGGLYGIYQHGPRERSLSPSLGDVLADHKVRYEWAASVAKGCTVMDAPCGTGYGATYLAGPSKHYVGIDRDTESVKWGREHYCTPKTEFLSRQLPDQTLGQASVDLFVTFEGIEHIRDQAGFVAMMAHVIRPGGTFVLSTPQKGATPGTAWDRYMLTQPGLAALFGGPEWRNIEWHCQIGYGAPHPVIQGCPPHVPIMLLRGVRA